MVAILRTAALRVSSVGISARSFSTTVARKDLVQDLYLNQLRSYKPAPQAKDAHVGTVKSYTAPTTPQAPSLPSDLASELSKFDSLEPALASSTPATKDVSAETGEEGAAGANEYLAFLEKDLPKADAAHH